MKIAVLVSGGVDSSVALALLRAQGHTVTAFYLKIWLEDELSYLGNCPWEDDLVYVRAVCHKLDVPLEVLSLQQAYHERVVSYTINEVRAGRTPNPDIMCNTHIKFGLFLDTIDASYDAVATGHYAQVSTDDQGIAQLIQAPDPIKDQTYFLSQIGQNQLKRLVFPIGHLIKEQVRTLAQSLDLPNKDRKDSQGICFLGKFKFKDFIKAYMGEKEGLFIEAETGACVGRHKGYWFYTSGQRQGLGLAGGPWYVVRKDVLDNVVFVSKDYYAVDKKRNAFTITRCNWLSGQEPEAQQLLVKVRHGVGSHTAYIKKSGDGRFIVSLADRDQGIAPGQFAAVYDGTVCLGGGVIDDGYRA